MLLTGESGTGKDLVAKVIHYASDRASRPFMNITCSALPEQLLESELFGHERGAFTDARMQKKGLLETADGGTVFLDEIGEMTPALQAKLLRFLEEKSFKRVGGAADIHVDVRVIAATNRNLEDEVGKSQFRSDLFYRLNVLPIAMPPLRSHAEDIPLLVEYFIDGFNTEFRKKVLGATPAAYAVLQRYGWPGNVRELRNVIERAMLLSDHDRLDAKDFAALSAPGRRPATSSSCRPRESISSSWNAACVVQALQAERRQSDARRRAARVEPRPDPLPHREVRADHGALALRGEAAMLNDVATTDVVLRDGSTVCVRQATVEDVDDAPASF